MIIRADIVRRANTVLKGWENATEFTKAFLLMDWATSIDGLTREELAVILFPNETEPNGAPTDRAVGRTRSLLQRIRRHPMSEGMAIFSIPRRITVYKPNIGNTTQIAWFMRNVMKREDWDAVRSRLVKLISGFKGTIKKYDVVIQESPSSRKVKIQKAIEELETILQETGGQVKVEPNNTKKKKKRNNNN